MAVVKVEREKIKSLMDFLEEEVGPVQEYSFVGKGLISVVLKERNKSTKEAIEQFGAEVRNWWPI